MYLMREKSDAGNLLKSFVAMAKRQFGKEVKIIRIDNKLEFKSRTMLKFYLDNGILHQTACVDTPQQNGRVERKQHHVLNMARALRFQARLPLDFLGECVLTAVHLITTTPNSVL